MREEREYMNKIIRVCCLECGKKYDKKHKSVMGVWKDTCDVCHKVDVPCADAAHDFGIYSTKEIKARDEFDDLL